MGEVEKKPEESKDGKKPEETTKAEAPPKEIVLKVYMHCEGCARKVRRCLKGFEGVEDVITDCRSSKVVVKGEKADPLRVLERVESKSHRQVVLLSPLPKPPAHVPEKPEEKDVVKTQEKKVEPPVIITVMLGVYMHCEACAQEIKKRIQRMKGVESAEPDLKNSQVRVKGVFEPEKLVDYVQKRAGKHAVIVKVESEKEANTKEEKDETKKGEVEVGKESKDGTGAAVELAPPGKAKPAEAGETEEEEEDEEESKVDVRRNEFLRYYYPQNHQVNPPRYVQDMYAYPPQMFSDENPNACSVM